MLLTFCFIIPSLISNIFFSTELPANLAATVAKANGAMHFCDQLFELGIDGAKQLEQCKKLFALGVSTLYFLIFHDLRLNKSLDRSRSLISLAVSLAIRCLRTCFFQAML